MSRVLRLVAGRGEHPCHVDAYSAESRRAASRSSRRSGLGYDAPVRLLRFARSEPVTLATNLPDVAVTSRSVWDQRLEARGLAPAYSMNVLNYDAMSDVLLPRAAGYAAGFLEHFFAGQLDASVQPAGQTDPAILKLVARNGSKEAVEGVLLVYAEEAVSRQRQNVLAPTGAPLGAVPTGVVLANGQFPMRSTVGLPPGGRGAIYALDADNGKQLLAVRHDQGAMAKPGGGWRWRWQPLSVDGNGRVYAGIANPAPWGGSRRFPNGGWYRRQTLYTDSLVVLDGASGDLVWYDQVLRTTSGTTTSSSRPSSQRWRVGPRDRRGKGGRICLGSGHPRADLDAGRGNAPQRRRPIARDAGRGVPRPLRRRPHARWRTQRAGCSSRSSSSACGRAR